MVGQSGVFVVRDDTLVPMRPTPFDNEDDFQNLLARFPDLLPGDQIDPENPRRWVLVRREQAVATGEGGTAPWSLDHLFLDQDGIPTLVEIKRGDDTRVRRKVVGQMLDYAANCAAYWSVDTLRSGFEKTCQDNNRASGDVLAELVGADQVELFWGRVEDNLKNERLRLLFVADAVPVELRRIVEFLNRRMPSVEVLAVELRHFTGEGLKTIVPLVVGQDPAAATKRNAAAPTRRWTEQDIFDKLAQTLTVEEVKAARRIYDWMRADGRALIFGTGRDNGSVYPLLKVGGTVLNPAYLSTEGRLWLQFGSLKGKPVFGDLGKRRDLMQRLGAVQGAGFTEADLEKLPSLPLSKIASDPEGPTKVVAALQWMADQLAAAQTSG